MSKITLGKRILSMAVALCLAMALVPMAAIAAASTSTLAVRDNLGATQKDAGHDVTENPYLFPFRVAFTNGASASNWDYIYRKTGAEGEFIEPELLVTFWSWDAENEVTVITELVEGIDYERVEYFQTIYTNDEYESYDISLGLTPPQEIQKDYGLLVQGKAGTVYEGYSDEVYYYIWGIFIEEEHVVFSNLTATYDGTAKRPTVVVTYDSTVLVEGEDYELKYYTIDEDGSWKDHVEEAVEVGEYAVGVSGRGNLYNVEAIAWEIFTIVDSEGDKTIKFTEVIAPQYDDARGFSEGLAAVKKDGKWGYIDAAGNVVIDFDYDYAARFSEGLAVVGTLGTAVNWGEEVIDVFYMGILDQQGGYTPFAYSGNYNEEEYEPYITCDWLDDSQDMQFYGGWIYLRIGHVEERLFRADGKQYLLETEEADGVYYYAIPRDIPTEGIMYCTSEGAAHYRDVEGNLLFGLQHLERQIEDGHVNFYGSSPFNQGIAFVREVTSVFSDGYEETSRFGAVDTSGNWVFEPQFEDYMWLGEYKQEVFGAETGIAMVQKDGLWGGINKRNETMIPFIYEGLMPYQEGLAAFKQDGAWGFFDESQTVVIEPQFDEVTLFLNNYSLVMKDGLPYVLDTLGNQAELTLPISERHYFHEDGSVFHPGEYIITFADGKYGYTKIEVEKAPGEPTTHTITASAGSGGTISPSGAVSVLDGDDQTFTITANSGYKISDVTVDGVSVGAVTTYTFSKVGTNHTISATFVSTGGGGYTPPSTGGAPAPAPVPVPAPLDVDTILKDTTDVPVGSWFRDAVAEVMDSGLMKGTGGGKFSPDNTLTRGMFVTILHRLAGEPAPGADPDFTDVKLNDWYTDAVAWAVEHEITAGDGSGGFGVTTDIDRQSIVVFLYRFLNSQNKLGDKRTADLAAFPDSSAVASWAHDAVTWAVANGILTGNGAGLNPNGTATRAEAATILVRVIHYLDGLK